jgi:hypothetical protein
MPALQLFSYTHAKKNVEGINIEKKKEAELLEKKALEMGAISGRSTSRDHWF